MLGLQPPGKRRGPVIPEAARSAPDDGRVRADRPTAGSAAGAGRRSIGLRWGSIKPSNSVRRAAAVMDVDMIDHLRVVAGLQGED